MDIILLKVSFVKSWEAKLDKISWTEENMLIKSHQEENTVSLHTSPGKYLHEYYFYHWVVITL